MPPTRSPTPDTRSPSPPHTAYTPPGGRAQVAVRHSRPDQRGRNRLPAIPHRIDHVHAEPVPRAEPAQRLDVARAAAAEAVVVAQHQLLHPEAAAQHLPHEGLGGELRQLARERHPLDAVERQPAENGPLLIRRRQQLRCRRRVHDLERMRLERDEQTREPSGSRPAGDLLDHRLVPAVNPVERPDGDDRTARRHPSSTTRGFRTSPTRTATATSAPPWNNATLPPSPVSPPAGIGLPCAIASRSPTSSSRRGRSLTSAAGSRPSAAVTASGATASSSRNGPTRVRRRARRWPPHPRASPTSRARLRRYVPALTVARNCASGGSQRTSSSSRTSTVRGGGCTPSPRRARRWARSPAIFTAEYAGGRCAPSPRNAAGPAATAPAVSARHPSAVACTRPVPSAVSVVVPSRITPSYALSHPAANGASRVARPVTSTSSPSANGSREPRCPTRRSPSARRTMSTTSCDVGPAGFATRKISRRPPSAP